MKLNVNIIISVTIFLVLSLIMHFWAGHYYKNTKFKTFLTLVTTITSIIFSAAIMIQVINYNNSRDQEEILKHAELSKMFLDDIITLFIDHPEMNYYYNEIIGIKNIDQNTKRNLVLENQMSMLIFSKIAKFAMFIQETDDPEITKITEKWLGHVTKTFMNSNTLRNYWSNEYKPKLSGPAAKKYMKDHYNL
jgi:hypothetical protein